MLLSEDHRAVQDAVRTYVQERIAPHAAAWDKSHRFPKEELRGLADLGCYGVAVPTEYDGAGLDYLALAVILEEIAAGDGATSTVVSVNNCPVCSILMAFGNDAQKERYLKPLARGDMLGAFCLTEPHVGSEAGGLKTSARLDGDHYVLNGVKQFITSGKNGDVAIVMAVTDKAAGKKGISAFLVPTDTPGYTVARLEDKMGQHASDTAQIVFDTGGGGLQATGFAAHVRFGQAEGAELLAARQRHQETLPLLGVAVGHEDGTDGAVVDADHGAGGAVAGGDLLQDDGQRQIVQPGAAQLGRHRHAVAAEFGQAAQRGGGEGVALVPGGRMRRHFGLHIGAHGILHGAVVIGQQHAGTLVGCTTGGSMPHCGLVRCRASMP